MTDHLETNDNVADITGLGTRNHILIPKPLSTFQASLSPPPSPSLLLSLSHKLLKIYSEFNIHFYDTETQEPGFLVQ